MVLILSQALTKTLYIHQSLQLYKTSQLIYNFQMKKGRHRDGKWLAYRHTAGKWKSWGSTQATWLQGLHSFVPPFPGFWLLSSSLLMLVGTECIEEDWMVMRFHCCGLRHSHLSKQLGPCQYFLLSDFSSLPIQTAVRISYEQWSSIFCVAAMVPSIF